MHIRRSEDVLDFFWTSYVHSIYVLCPGGSTWFYFWLKEEKQLNINEADPLSCKSASFKVANFLENYEFIRKSWNDVNNKGTGSHTNCVIMTQRLHKLICYTPLTQSGWTTKEDQRRDTMKDNESTSFLCSTSKFKVSNENHLKKHI